MGRQGDLGTEGDERYAIGYWPLALACLGAAAGLLGLAARWIVVGTPQDLLSGLSLLGTLIALAALAVWLRSTGE